MRSPLWSGLGCLVLVISLSKNLCAQEAIIYWHKIKPAVESTVFSSPVEAVRGTIDAMDDQLLACILDGKKERIAADQVVGIQVRWEDPKVAEANAAYNNLDFRDARVRFKELAGSAPGRWQQKMLVLKFAAACEASGLHANAAKAFLLAEGLKLPAFCYAYLPLAWINEPTDPAALADLEKELGDKGDPTSQLILSSWRLGSAKRDAAVSALEALTKRNDVPIGMLARAQLWRVTPPQKFVSEQLSDALKFRDKMPYGLQAGPTAIIANQFERAGDYDTAFDYWTEVAILSKYAELPLLYVAARQLEDIANKQGRVEQWDALKETLKNKK